MGMMRNNYSAPKKKWCASILLSVPHIKTCRECSWWPVTHRNIFTIKSQWKLENDMRKLAYEDAVSLCCNQRLRNKDMTKITTKGCKTKWYSNKASSSKFNQPWCTKTRKRAQKKWPVLAVLTTTWWEQGCCEVSLPLTWLVPGWAFTLASTPTRNYNISKKEVQKKSVL